MKKSLLIIIIILNLLSTSLLRPELEKSNELKEENEIILRENNKNLDFNFFDKSSGFFTENKGQWPSEVLFVANLLYGRIGLGNNCIYLDIWSNEINNVENDLIEFSNFNDQNLKSKGCVIKINFLNMNRITPEGLDPLTYKTNYILGNNPNKLIKEVNSYQKILYKNIWNSIDLVYYFNNKGLKYDFIIHPGGDISDIEFVIEGQRSINIDGNILIINTPINLPIFDDQLFVYYQESREIINGKHLLLSEKSYGFHINDYEKNKTIVIDPLISSTYLGGNDRDDCNDMAIDEDGNVYITGGTRSVNFPVEIGSYDTSFNGGKWDIFVLKINKDFSDLIFSTFIGGTGDDGAWGIALDSNSNIILTGETLSSDFPNTTGAFDNDLNGTGDCFILKLSADGSDLLYSSYIGGSGYDTGEDIQILTDNEVVVSGLTKSQDFPNTTKILGDNQIEGKFDIYILKLNIATSNLIFSTMIGGDDDDYIEEFVVDPQGNFYLTGKTESENFPTTSGCFDNVFNDTDPYVLKLDSNGDSIIFSTFVGGEVADASYSITLDSDLNVYIAGSTGSVDFPVSKNAFDTTKNETGYSDSFVSKLNPQGSNLVFSTFLGGTKSERVYDIEIDDEKNIVITGATLSSDFPITYGVYDNTHNGVYDSFITIFNPKGTSLLYSSYIGGGEMDSGRYIEIDTDGNIICSGETKTSNFPTTANAFDRIYNGGEIDIFLLKLNLSILPTAPQDLHIKSGDKFASLNWEPPLDNGGVDIMGYNIYRKIGISNYKLIERLPIILFFNDTDVNNGKTYYYKISSNNSIGEGIYSEEVEAKPMTKPKPPYDLQITSGDRYIDLSWSKPVDDGGSTVLYYKLYKGTDSNNLEDIKEINTNNISFWDTNVVNGQIFFYYITSFNIVGESIASNMVNATPLAPPTQPLSLQVIIGDKYINLSWQESVDNGGSEIVLYRIFKGYASDEEIYFNYVNGTELYYNDTDVKNGISYYYYITSVNIAGESNNSNELMATPFGLPSPPTILNINSGDKYINITWQYPSDNGGAKILNFKIYKENGSSKIINEIIINASILLYNDTDVINGNTYFYYMSALNIAGESNLSYSINATPMAKPNPPENLLAREINGFVNLTWDKPNNNGGSDIIEYKIYRGNSSNNGTFLITLKAYSIFYLDELITPGNTYFYYITAINRIGESNPSKEINITLIKDNDDDNKTNNSKHNNNETTTDDIKNNFILFGSIIIIIIIIIFLMLINRKKKTPKIDEYNKTQKELQQQDSSNKYEQQFSNNIHPKKHL